LAHVALRWWIQRKARREAAVEAAAPDEMRVRHWVARGLREILPALALLIWIHGLFFAISLLLRRTATESVLASSLTALEWVYSLALVAALFWLLSRIGRLVE